MNAVMISIQPIWVEKILSGEKTIEVRKTKPKLQVPFKCYIYQTKRNCAYKVLHWLGLYQGKVVAEFTCDKVKNIFSLSRFWGLEDIEKQSCLSGDEIRNYANGAERCYAWHISDLVVYDKPKELSEFNTERITTTDYPKLTKINRPPQSWCYVERSGWEK